MAKAPPSFNFYHSDFMAGTAHLNYGEIGCYTMLLCYQWANGSIPRDKDRLSRICRCSLEELNRIWPMISDKFVAADHTGETLVNPRMESDRAESIHQWEPRRKKRSQEEIAAIRADAGRKGAEKRWQNDGKTCDIPDEKWQNDGKRMAKHGKWEEGRGNKELGIPSNTVAPNRMDTSESKPIRLETSSKDSGKSTRSDSESIPLEPSPILATSFDIDEITRSSNPEIDEKAVHASRNERRALDSCPESTRPVQHAPESILCVRTPATEPPKNGKAGKLDGPAKVLLNGREQTINLPAGMATRRVELVIQKWLDYCQSMGKLPQVMALENQLEEVARANPTEDDFVAAIRRTIANNCDPHNFKPRLWAREWVGSGNGQSRPEREPDKVYPTLAELKAAGAI